MPATLLSLAVVAAVLVPLAQPTAGAPAAALPPRVVLAAPDVVQRRVTDGVLSGDGRYLSMLTSFGDTPTTLRLRDFQESASTAVPTAGEGSAQYSSLSGDGRLVAYSLETLIGTRRSHVVYSVDREASADAQLHQVTGTPNDLPYLRTSGCTFRFSCALSADGTTLALAVRQTIDSPSMALSLDGGPLSNPSTGLFEPLVDFGRRDAGGTYSLDLHVDALDPLVFPESGPSVGGDPAFRIDPSTAPCAGTVAAGTRCTVRVTYAPPENCDYQLQGTLRLPGTTPAGQSAVALLGDCAQGGGEAVDAPRVVEGPCTGASTYDGSLPSASEPHEGISGALTFAPGEATTRKVSMFALRVSNASETPSTVGVYTEAGCAFKLVVPTSQPADACQPGVEIEGGSSCVAYVEFAPDQIAPYAAEIAVGGTDYRLIARSGQTVIAAWKDPSGRGDFAAAGPARVVSAEGPDGTPMEAYSPSLSADGRYVAYTSASKLGRPAGDTTNRQIYVHDTNADGNGAHGQTVLASYLPDGRLVMSADAPSLSGDGTRVAFADTHETEPQPNEYIQGYVRDLPTQKTIVASSSPTGAPGDSFTSFPVISTDGQSVAYQSMSGNLTDAPAPNSWQVYVRDLQADFTGGRGTNQLMSVDESGQPASDFSGFPSISADGSVVSFRTGVRLTFEDNDDLDDVYVSTRTGSLDVSPDQLDFGQVPVRSTSAQQVATVTNSGAPVTLGKLGAVDAPFQISSDQCSNKTLHDGESCAIGFVFAPTTVGTETARLYIPVPNGTVSDDANLRGTGTSDATTPGETKLVSVDDDPASAIENNAPAISNDGRYVAFRSSPANVGGGFVGNGVTGPKARKVTEGSKGKPAKKARVEPGPRSAVVEALTADAIHLRDQLTGTTERLSLPEHVPGTPDVSGNAQLVSYLGMTRDQDGNPLQRSANVYAVNRKDPAAPVVRAVTGLPSDLPYQRTNTNCDSDDCVPRLSDDGTSIVYSTKLTWYSSSLELQVPYQGAEPRSWDLIDFSPTASGTGPYTQQVTAHAYDPVDFTGGPVVDGGEGAFRINGTTCGSTLAAGQTCTIDVEFVAPRCGETFVGTLRTQGRIPAGQTATPLVGTLPCPVIIGAAPDSDEDEDKPGANAPGCATIPAPATAPYIWDGTETPIGNPESNSMYLDLGDDPHYTGMRITNDSTVSAFVRFETPQCGMAFVTPGQPNADLPTCQDGQTLAVGASCAAYAGFDPDAIGSYLANVTLFLGNPNLKVHRFVGVAEQDAVLMRRDPSGNGDFAGAGAPEIVSLDGAGGPMSGDEPVVSGDGRYVGYLSRQPVGRDPDPDGNDSTQLYLRDRTAKTTKVVSQLPDGSLDELGVMQPSISRDGKRLAFATWPRGEGPTPPYTQVYVRDLEAGKTILASASLDDPTVLGNSDSYSPSLSDDGTTVAFGSLAGNLVSQPTTGSSLVYVREVERDFAGDSPLDNDLVSVTNEGRVVGDRVSYGPAVNDDGAFVAFGSSAGLVPEDTDGVAADVYVRRRFAQLQVEPAALDFGAVKLGTTSAPKRVTVSNAGSGPADIGTVTAAAPFAPGAETCAKLRRGKTCTVDATFAPIAEGPVSGALNLPVSQGYLALPGIGATLAGVGEKEPVPPIPPASYTVAPTSVDFGSVLLGKEAAPASLTVLNTGEVPLAFTVTTSSPLGDFAADGAPCAVLMPAQSCVVPVRFAPRALGSRAGAVAFTADAQDPLVKDPAPTSVPLTGKGVEKPTGPGPEPKVAAMTVTPLSLAFPAGLLNVAGAPKRVVVRNVGEVPLAVAGEVRSGATEFYSRSTSCLILLPGAQCAIDVRFAPRSLGARAGALTVLAASVDPLVVSPFPVQVAMAGTTKQPKLVLDPTVGRPGQVTMVRGENFPPTQQIALSWQLGLGTALAKPDAAGTFTVPMLVYRRDMLGDRILAAAIPSLLAPTLSEPYLVEPLSGQPPGFFFRW